MKLQRALQIFSYSAASIFTLCGVAVLSGYLIPVYIPAKFKILFGIVLILYGIYRVVIIRTKNKAKNSEREFI